MAPKPRVHPGRVLRDDFLAPIGISPDDLARALCLPAKYVNGLVKGKRPITAQTALRLARYFGTTAEFWMNLEAAYELRVVRNRVGKTVTREVPSRPYLKWSLAMTTPK